MSPTRWTVAREEEFRSRSARRSGGLPAGGEAPFRALILSHHRDRGRDFPWRRTRDPFAILVSEFMLQQTQVGRVEKKYGPFLARFPDFRSLASSPLSELLRAWQGLGYHRRALSLRRTALIVESEHRGRLPADTQSLRKLPGIGPATAGALAAFAFGRAVPFLETNIRRVYLHFFFPGAEGVRDGDLLDLVELTLDHAAPRRWYYALMDYGSMLKGRGGENPNRRSAHYRRQSLFEGSDRQLRARMLRLLLARGPLRGEQIACEVDGEGPKVASLLERLCREGFIVERQGFYRVA